MNDDGGSETVFKIGRRRVSRRMATNLFNMVAPKDNWKNPINATVDIYDAFHLQALERAITFFTGSIATVTTVGTHRYRIKADGYYLTIGA